MTISQKLITVYGATGNQGGSVARSLLKNPDFHVRALTRSPNSAASQELVALGAEIAKADGFSYLSMVAAFRGPWSAFVNINSSDASFEQRGLGEFDLGKLIVDAAAEAGVQHLVFSTGPNCIALTGSEVLLKAMDMKYKIEQYIRSIGRFQAANFICAAWFLENFLPKELAPVFGGFPYVENPEGYLTFRSPNWGGDETVPFVGIECDFGDIVQGIFLQPERAGGKVVHGCSAIRSFDDVVADFQKATGRKARFEPVLPSWRAFETYDSPELEEVKGMFGLTQTSGGRYFGPEVSESETAGELKTITAAALGGGHPAQLVSVEQFFRQHVG
ncbi:hypothetical protein BDW62DRAFT_216836 [Aspergillus aurantiobrunneus]